MRKISDNQKLIEKFKNRYWKANRKEKKEILNGLEELTGCDRKYLNRQLLNRRSLEAKKLKYDLLNKLPRKTKYSCIDEELTELWKISNYETGKRLVGSIPSLIDSLVRHGEKSYSREKIKLLKAISSSTIDRRLHEIKLQEKQNIRNTTGTIGGDLLKSQIPIRTHRDWVEKRPGYLEIDTVHHCLGDLSGKYALTLDTVDVYSGWNTCRAMLGKSSQLIRNELSVITQRTPFKIKGIDFDSGVEFVNFDVINHCKTHHWTYTRSRTDRKNDQCFIEQNNDSVVRKYVGYARYETKEEIALLNQIYALLSDYYNYFQAVMRLETKTYNHTHRFPTRHYQKAMTPYQRLLNCSHINEETKQQLTSHYLTLNPKRLHDEISKLRNELTKLNQHNRPFDYFGAKFSPSS